MSKFLDEAGLTHLVSKFNGIYANSDDLAAVQAQQEEMQEDINKAMYGPYSVGYESVQFTYGAGQGTVENKSLTLTDAMGDNAPRIYVIDLSLSQRTSTVIIRNLNLQLGSSMETDISALSPSTTGYQDRFNNLSGGIQRVVIRFTGSVIFGQDPICISLKNGYFYKPYTLSTTSAGGTVGTQPTYKILKLKVPTDLDTVYVIIDFVGHGKPRLSTLTTTCYAVPQLVGCMGWLTNSLT